jgi:hypothetical protein
MNQATYRMSGDGGGEDLGEFSTLRLLTATPVACRWLDELEEI